jgi:hypothetical protein
MATTSFRLLIFRISVPPRSVVLRPDGGEAGDLPSARYGALTAQVPTVTQTPFAADWATT